jgi:uncharacterized membrane protein
MDFNAKTSGNFVLYAILTLSSNVRFSLVTETSYSPAYFDYKLIFSLCDALRDITEKKSTAPLVTRSSVTKILKFISINYD